MSELNRSPITCIQPTDLVFVDIRELGNAHWYSELYLGSMYTTSQVLANRYTRWINNMHTKIQVTRLLFNEFWTLNHVQVKRYCSTTVLPTTNTVLIHE